MFKLQYISQNEYEIALERFKPDKTKEKSGGFGATVDKRCLQEKGQKFVALVANNLEQGFITHNDALDFLSIKAKNLEKVLSRVKK
jgi:hypothetical protein